eukprot:14289751-Alexandrium_andersonii.AAC.1
MPSTKDPPRRSRPAETAARRRARRQRQADRLICHAAATAPRPARYHGNKPPPASLPDWRMRR